MSKSVVFGPVAATFAEAERAAESFLLLMLLNQYRRFCAVNKPSQYDVKAAAAVEARMAELQAGAPGNIPILKRWRPSARA